jgi:hypothetical protein
MSNSKDFAGSAFPYPMVTGPESDECHQVGESGMTLREWFAGMALQGLLANGGVATRQGDNDYRDATARAAFAYADAMLAQSKKEGGS